MANQTVLPGSISKAAHLKALDLMVGDRLSNIDVSTVMINLIDTCPAVALPFLAQQFNLTGYRGWQFMNTEQEQRNLLKNALALNRFAGTGFGVIQALQAIGIVGAIEVQERFTPLHDGTLCHDGSIYHGRHWAHFRVLIDIANINGLALDAIREVIKIYKGVRNWLVDVGYKLQPQESVSITENLIIIQVP